MNQPHNPYAAPAHPVAPPSPTAAGLPPPPEVSVVAAIKWSFSGVGFGNLAIGLLLLFIPMVGGLLLMGWVAETHRRLALRVAPAVPKFSFSEFGSFMMSGLPMFAVQMAASFLLMIPLMVLAGAGAAVAASSPEPGVGMALFLGVFFLLTIGLSFLLTVVLVPMVTRGELSGSLKEAFNISAAWSFAKRNFWSVLGHHIVLGILVMPLMFLGLLAVFIGMYFVAIAVQFAGMHLRWQLYERDVAQGGEAVVVRNMPGADF